jgi:hypothetical protein
MEPQLKQGYRKLVSEWHPTQTVQPSAIVDEKGPWPFVTRRVFHSPEVGQQVWSSRHHRKGLLMKRAAEAEDIALTLLRCLWMPDALIAGSGSFSRLVHCSSPGPAFFVWCRHWHAQCHWIWRASMQSFSRA